jgi:dihydroorotate dehydrogenase (NAD+) catalytic subunit
LESTHEKKEPATNLDISFHIAGFKMQNPMMLASGILGVTPDILKHAADAGAGAVVMKSISVEPRQGYRNPTIVEVEGGYVNAVGLSNPGLNVFAAEMRGLKKKKPIPVVASLFGSTPEEFNLIISTLESTPVDCYELNLSCPHVEKVGLEVGQDSIAVSKVVKAAKQAASRPVLVKISPNLTSPAEIAVAAESAGADAITAVNTVRAMVIDVETGQPILSHRVGGLSGSAIKPVAVRCVHDVSKRVTIPVIGCGGISTWSDAVEFLLAGASAIQIGSAVGYRGLNVFNEISDGIKSYMMQHDFKNIGEIVGRAHNNSSSS